MDTGAFVLMDFIKEEIVTLKVFAVFFFFFLVTVFICSLTGQVNSVKSIEISIPVVVLSVVIIVSLVVIALIWFKYKGKYEDDD